MSNSQPVETIQADDAAIEAALEHAHLPSLMLALVHLTGDMGICRGDIRPETAFMSPTDGLTDEQRNAVRAQALAALIAHRDNPKPLYMPTDAELREMLMFTVGDEVSEDYVEFLTSELSMAGEEPYAQPLLDTIPAAARKKIKVLVIGAGMSGVLCAVRLKQAGIDFEVIEKNSDVGGTWLENTYPGCRVDSANHTYSYSFRPQDWPQHFSQQAVLKQYFSDTADEFDVRNAIRFDTEVREARFDETTDLWHVTVADVDGRTETITANAVISAVGQLNRPKLPDIEGRDDYRGVAFHSAEWNHDLDLKGKRIGVIGTGASAFQFIPIVAEQAQSVTVFQRTAPWIIPNQEYFTDVPTGKHWLLRHVPFYAKWFRFSMFWRSAEGLLRAVRAEEGWNRPEESVSSMNQMFRDLLIKNVETVLGDRSDLIEACTPNYPPGAKRALIDDGKYLRALKRDNVHLTTDPIERVTETGVRTAQGDDYEFDVIVYATGFQASTFLHPMKIYGLGGRELHDTWDGEPRAYKGISIPGYPNLFCCYGPNTNIVVNGSIIFFSECEVRYILGCLGLCMTSDAKALDVRKEVHDTYNEWIDRGNLGMAWGQSSVNTWYKNASGRITQNWPFTMLEFWQQTRAPDPEDYHFI